MLTSSSNLSLLFNQSKTRQQRVDGTLKSSNERVDLNGSQRFFSFFQVVAYKGESWFIKIVRRIEHVEWNDISALYPAMMDLKNINPDLKVTLALGGWNHGSEPFTFMVQSKETRALLRVKI